MHTSSDVDNISSDTDASGRASIGPFVHATSVCTAGDVMQERSIQHHLYMGVVNPQQLLSSAPC